MARGSLLAVGVACAVSASAPPARGGDPKAECLAAADQGQSLRDDGKYRRAHDAFVTCSNDACPKVVARSCAQWLRQLDDASPTVVLGAKDGAGADLTTAHVTIDGEPLTEALDGKPQPIDPGEHTLRFTRPGSNPAETHVVVRAGEKNRPVVVTLRAAAQTPAVAPEPTTSAEPQQPSIFTTRNVTVAMLGVLGAAAVGGGAYFLSQSGSQSSTASGLRSGLPSDACTLNPSSPTCVQLKNAVDTQHSDTTIGVAMLVGGGVLLVGAAVAWFAWPAPGDEKTGLRVVPGLGPGRASLGVAGSF
jgi:hypothetical protein